MKTRIFAILAAATLLPCATIAQQPGTARELDIVPTDRHVEFTFPTINKGHAVADVYSSKVNLTTGIQYSIPLDGSGKVERKLFPQHAKLEGEVGSTYFDWDDSSYRSVLQIWDKETGHVDLRLQTFNRADAQPVSASVPVGMIPLDRKSYKGSALSIKAFPSPDSSKTLLYFDEIQSQGIKLAMCWVVDREGDPIWNGAYRLPVQALGSKTTITFTDGGQVLVEVSAVLLDEDNTREKKDGTMQAKVDQYYANRLSTTVYVMHGDEFLSWDGRIPGDADASYLKVVDTPDGLRFLASVQKGKRKDAACEWVLGKLDAGFKPEVLATGSLHAPLNQVMYTKATSFHALSFHDGDLTVIHIGIDGKVDWQHTGPLTKVPDLKQFRIIADRLVYYQRWTKGSIKDLLEGSAANLDLAGNGIPTLVTWKNGTRKVTPLISLDAPGKEVPIMVYEYTLCEEGILMRMPGQKNPSSTFVPLTWD